MRGEIGLDRSEEEVCVPAGECWSGPGQPGAVSQTRTLDSVCVHFGDGTPGCVVRMVWACVVCGEPGVHRTGSGSNKIKSNGPNGWLVRTESFEVEKGEGGGIV